MQSVINISTFT